MQFYSWWYRCRLWTLRHLQWRDCLPVAGAVLAALLAINSYSLHPTLSIVLGLLYIVVIGVHFGLGVRARRALDVGRGELLGTLFAFINEQVFGGDHRTRFTLFVPAPGRPDYIIPWYRYREGGSDPISEARRSRARYRRNEGETGKAWAEAGRKVLVSAFPRFNNKQEFTRFYVTEMKVSPTVVQDLSDYMVEVQAMFSYGCVGSNHRTMGVLSLDLQAPLSKTDRGYSFPSPDGDTQVELDFSRLELLFQSVQNMLEGFGRADSAPIRV